MSGYAPIAIELSRYNQGQNEKLFGGMAATLDHILMADTHLFGFIQGVGYGNTGMPCNPLTQFPAP